VHLEVLCAEMALSSEEHLNVLLGGVEDCGEVAGSHLDGLALQKLVGVVRLSRYSQFELLMEGEPRLAIFACARLARRGSEARFAGRAAGLAQPKFWSIEHVERRCASPSCRLEYPYYRACGPLLVRRIELKLGIRTN
jgi:hypothetical protein